MQGHHLTLSLPIIKVFKRFFRRFQWVSPKELALWSHSFSVVCHISTVHLATDFSLLWELASPKTESYRVISSLKGCWPISWHWDKGLERGKLLELFNHSPWTLTRLKKRLWDVQGKQFRRFAGRTPKLGELLYPHQKAEKPKPSKFGKKEEENQHGHLSNGAFS